MLKSIGFLVFGILYAAQNGLASQSLTATEQTAIQNNVIESGEPSPSLADVYVVAKTKNVRIDTFHRDWSANFGNTITAVECLAREGERCTEARIHVILKRIGSEQNSDVFGSEIKGVDSSVVLHGSDLERLPRILANPALIRENRDSISRRTGVLTYSRAILPMASRDADPIEHILFAFLIPVTLVATPVEIAALPITGGIVFPLRLATLRIKQRRMARSIRDFFATGDRDKTYRFRFDVLETNMSDFSAE